jgi:hypothetical protein
MASYFKIKLLYKMMFPLGQFNEDYLSACLNIRREIKNMCKPELKLPLLMIIAALDMTPKPTINTKLSELCRIIRINTENYCLGLKGQESAQTLIHMKTGAIPHENSSLICDRIYDILSHEGKNIDDFLIVRLYSTQTVINLLHIDESIIFFRAMRYFRYGEQLSVEDRDYFLKIISKPEIKNVIFQDLETGNNVTFTLQDKEFLKYLHELIISKRIPFDITVEELCSNGEVLKFRSSVAL